ncbi:MULTISPECIES: tyrosine-type recombinase/integrase [Mesonia]|uniref:Tyrosine recombinase XerC n=1 Tax=Mesonia oceanica TaxID=2687242 RepID=A0AC61Y9S1_9FLAO|nr:MULTISPECIES: tyrosine-type recombinase/integrase [Mesonia]MAN27974.1 integrase [Mesonia sp.]MAQ41154.1 integrase [Mesonia sp.]VVV01252.1 Tyrosine recombinase XerC [Mesonia oceanica]|tara:strand:- start:486 stop:1379 length:894 start_codon:yes stop_codon:yes gene_type:complete
MASIQQFLDYLLYEKKYSSHTVLAYQKDLETFAVFIQNQFEEEELREVNYSMIRSWIISLVDNGISNRSINRKISSLKTFYKFLLKIKEIETSPLVKHKSLKVDKKVQVPFSSKEVSEVIESFQPEGFSEFRDQLIIELLYSTGMRRAELINLKLDSVDVSGKQLKVLGKRNKERIIPLLPTVLKTFQNYLLERSELAIINDEKYLLVTEKGNKLYDALVYRVVNNYFSRVSTKVKKSPHIIRHTFATHLLNEGADLNSVKELLGHSSLASTQVYTHNSIRELSKVYLNAHPRNKNK